MTRVLRFQEKFDFLPVESLNLEAGVETPVELRSWTFRRDSSGIWIPDQWHLVRTSPRTGKLTARRHFSLVDSSVNEELSPSVFGVDALELARGDRLEDTSDRSLLVYDGKGLVKASAYVPDAKVGGLKVGAVPMWRRVWIGVSVAAVVLLVIAGFWKQGKLFRFGAIR